VRETGLEVDELNLWSAVPAATRQVRRTRVGGGLTFVGGEYHSGSPGSSVEQHKGEDRAAGRMQ